jgi:hypothetical protein
MNSNHSVAVPHAAVPKVQYSLANTTEIAAVDSLSLGGCGVQALVARSTGGHRTTQKVDASPAKDGQRTEGQQKAAEEQWRDEGLEGELVAVELNHF